MSILRNLVPNRVLTTERKLKENIIIIHLRCVHIGYGTKNWFWYAFYNAGVSSRWVIRTKPQSSLVALLAHEHFFIFICLLSVYFLFFTPSTRKSIIYSHLSHTKTLGERGTHNKWRHKIQFQLSFLLFCPQKDKTTNKSPHNIIKTNIYRQKKTIRFFSQRICQLTDRFFFIQHMRR